MKTHHFAQISLRKRTAKFLLGGIALALSLPMAPAVSQAQHFYDRGVEVNGYNAGGASFADGASIRQVAPRQWTEFRRDGRPAFRFEETGRDEWSVYLFDRSRDVRVQLDFHRQMFLYQPPGGRMQDLYRLTDAFLRRGAAPRPAPKPVPRPPRPQLQPQIRSVEAGPIWSQADAERKCPALARQERARWTGQWRTTVPGRMSVCELEYRPGPRR